jgi:hypothetical protein
MALGTTDHDWDLTKLNSLGLVLLDELASLVTILVPFSLLDVDIDLGVNLVSHVPDSRLMREVGVDITSPRVFHHGLGPSIDLPKHYLVADVVILGVDSPSWQVLAIDLDHVVLVLIHTVRNHVLDEAIEGLNLLVNDTILLKVSIDDFPLIVNCDLVFAIEVLNYTANC